MIRVDLSYRDSGYSLEFKEKRTYIQSSFLGQSYVKEKSRSREQREQALLSRCPQAIHHPSFGRGLGF